MKKSYQFSLMLTIIFIVSTDLLFAQGGEAAISQASDKIKAYVGPVGTLVQAIGAVVGIVGGVRIYNKWNNGDTDVNKELVGWGGACIFLILVPTIVSAFFAL